MKENQIQELVNELRDIAIEYHGTQQLRERIARTVRAAWHHELEKPNQPVSQTYELPQTQLEQVADLYEMQFDDGRTCAFHTDGAKAAQWLLASDGNKVQEYVRIERYQEAVIGNSPVQSPIDHGYRPECECSGCKATARICAELNNEEAEIFADGYNAAMQSFGNYERLNQAPVKQPSSDEVIGWLRSDYNSDDKRDPNAPLFMLGSNDPSEAWGVKYIPLSGNSPVIPDGWVMVPKVVTAEIGNAINEVGQRCTCGNCSQRLWDLLLAAAPKPQNAPQNIPENIPAGKSTLTPDGWISCSERMPDDGRHVIILCDGAFVLYAQYRDGEFFDIVRNGNEFFETQSRNVNDWMPLPEPPQEEK